MPRLLHVTIFEGKDLIVHSDPYVVAELLNVQGRHIKKERARTKVMRGGSKVIFSAKHTRQKENKKGVIIREDVRVEGDVVQGDEEMGQQPANGEGVTLTLGSSYDLSNVGNLPTLRLSLLGNELLLRDHNMGVAFKDLAELPVDGTTITEWVKLEPTADMAEGTPCGFLRIAINLDAAEASRIVSQAMHADIDVDRYFAGIEEGPGDQDPQYADRKFNMLKVGVRRARNLLNLDEGSDVSDPYVKLTCDGTRYKTNVVKDSLSPEWDETFDFAVEEPSRRLHLGVFDEDLVHDQFLGKINVQLEGLMHRKRMTRWFELMDAKDLYDIERKRGEIELSLQWYHDPKAEKLLAKKRSIFHKVRRKLGVSESSSESEVDASDGEDIYPAKAPPDKSAIEEKNAAIREELQEFEVKSGDYTIYVHIIEARDLQAEDLQGTSDPVVYVEAFGQRFATEVKQACLSCVFDETFVISLRNLDKDVFRESHIKVSVMDADGPACVKNDLIGCYTFDAENVYFQKNHEIHRRWVALVDDEIPKDTKAQGYLQLSIAIVGPGDKLKVHDAEADRRKERAAEAKSGGLNGMVMIPPNIRTRTRWLVTTVVKAEYLPVMDSAPMAKRGGDFYTKVSVSGGADAHTRKKRVNGDRSKMNPVWHTQLWVPTVVPSMSGSVRTTVMDWDLVGDSEVTACANIKLRDLEMMRKRKHGFRWIPLYGPPIAESGAELTDLTSRLSQSVAQDDTDWRMIYQTIPEKASTYRGRILLARGMRDSLPPGKNESTPWRRKIKPLPIKLEPPTSRYAMRCYVASGSELPSQLSMKRMGRSFHMAIRISLGSEVLTTRMVENENGTCEWGELLESKDPIVLPSDPSQIPDVFVHLLRGSIEKTPICFFRIPARDLVDKGFKGIRPQWILLKPDKVLNCLHRGQYPGMLLIKLAFGEIRDFAATVQEWHEEALSLRHRASYLLRVHIYQGRDLPASDFNGLMDPYLKLQCQGKRLNTESFEHLGKHPHRRRSTVDPMWYFTWEADLSLPTPGNQAYFNHVSVELFDYDVFNVDDYAGCLFLDLVDVPIVLDQANIPPPPTPTWKQFFLEEPGDSCGELLVSCQLIKTTRSGLILPPPPNLTPELRPAYLEVLAIGIRGLQPYKMLPIQLPHLEVEVDLPGAQKASLTTNPSKKPSGADANFLEHLSVKLDLPADEIFAPRLKLRIVDNRLGGFLTPIVAVGAVDLAQKLPWARDYKPPAAVQVNAMDIMEAAGAPVFSRMFEQGQGMEEDAKSATSSAGERRTEQLTRLSPPLVLSPEPAASRPPSPKRHLLRPTPMSVAQLFSEESLHQGKGIGYAEEKQSQPPGGGGGDDVAPSSTVMVSPAAAAKGKGIYGTIFGERAAAAAAAAGGGAQGGASGAGGAMGLVLGTDGSDAPDTGVNIAAAASTRGGGAGELPAVEGSQPRAGSMPSSPVLFEGTETFLGVGVGWDSFRPIRTSSRASSPVMFEGARMLRRAWGGRDSLLPSQASSLVSSPVPFEEPGVLSRLLGVGDGLLPGSGGRQKEDEEEEPIVAPEVGIVEAMGQEDDGTGVFGAIFHEPAMRERVIATARAAKDSKAGDEDHGGPPKYMIGRPFSQAELEIDLSTTPFETYPLFRGQKFGTDSGAETYRAVGAIKCVVRVTIGHPDDEPMFAADSETNEQIMRELLRPKEYVVRLYVLQAINLTPMDPGMGGRPGKSDPYLRVTLGKEVFNDRENYIRDVTDADLYKCVEVACKLPGAGQLQIEVMDYDQIGMDGLIGKTVIDLEDRWFDQRWQRIGMENRVETETAPGSMRWQTKPMENRTLYVPTSNAPQGLLQCWVDVMEVGDAKVFEPDAVALPPAADFEVRLVIWKCKDVVSADWLSGLNDLFVKAWVEGSDPQETDTHWRAKNGKGSFNWRMKFQVKLGPRMRATNFPYLTIQMWDRDILKWNDCIAEGTLDLAKPFRKAFKNNTEVLKLFESGITEQGKKKLVSSMIERQKALAAEQAQALQQELDTGTVNPLLGDPANPDPNAEPDSPASYDVADIGAVDGRPGDHPSADAPLTCTDLGWWPCWRKRRRHKKRTTGCCCWKDKTPMSQLELRQENDRRKMLGLSLLHDDEGLTKKDAQRRRKEEGDEEVKELIQKLKEMAGLSSDDPRDSQWIRLERTDRQTGKKEPMGKCLIGIQLYPLQLAEVQPAGAGRGEPNNSPFLPPPSGRLSFTWNPLSMAYQLLGPRLCYILCCFVCVGITIVSLIALQPLWDLLVELAFK